MGGFTNELTWSQLHALYSIHDAAPATTNSQPPFNIAPIQDVDFLHLDKAAVDFRREVTLAFH